MLFSNAWYVNLSCKGLQRVHLQEYDQDVEIIALSLKSTYIRQSMQWHKSCSVSTCLHIFLIFFFKLVSLSEGSSVAPWQTQRILLPRHCPRRPELLCWIIYCKRTKEFTCNNWFSYGAKCQWRKGICREKVYQTKEVVLRSLGGLAHFGAEMISVEWRRVAYVDYAAAEVYGVATGWTVSRIIRLFRHQIWRPHQSRHVSTDDQTDRKEERAMPQRPATKA